MRAALAAVFENAARHLPLGGRALAGIAPEVAAAHGRLDAQASCQAAVRALAEVILPCASALLAGAQVSPFVAQGDDGPLTARSPA